MFPTITFVCIFSLLYFRFNVCLKLDLYGWLVTVNKQDQRIFFKYSRLLNIIRFSPQWCSRFGWNNGPIVLVSLKNISMSGLRSLLHRWKYIDLSKNNNLSIQWLPLALFYVTYVCKYKGTVSATFLWCESGLIACHYFI